MLSFFLESKPGLKKNPILLVVRDVNEIDENLNQEYVIHELTDSFTIELSGGYDYQLIK